PVEPPAAPPPLAPLPPPVAPPLPAAPPAASRASAFASALAPESTDEASRGAPASATPASDGQGWVWRQVSNIERRRIRGLTFPVPESERKRYERTGAPGRSTSIDAESEGTPASTAQRRSP